MAKIKKLKNVKKSVSYQKKDYINILIIHHYTLKNLGDWAILEGTINSIKEILPKSNFNVLSLTPDYDKKFIRDANFLPSIPPPIYSRKDYLYSLTFIIMSIIWGVLYRISSGFINLTFFFPKLYKETLKKYIDSDIIICRATDASFCPETFGYIPSIKGFYQLILAYLLKKDVMIYAQTIGPVKENLIGNIYKKFLIIFLNKAKVVTVRDTTSFNFLRKIGFKKVILTADPTYTLPVPVRKIKKELKITIIPRVSTKSMKNYEKYILIISSLIDFLIKKYNAKIIMCYQSKFLEDDDIIAIDKILSRRLDQKDKIIKIKREYSLKDYIETISSSNLIISTRVIGAVIGIMSCIPVIAIDYGNGKIRGFMELARMEDYCIDWKELNLDILKKKTISAIKNYRYIRKRLINMRRILKYKALSNNNLLLEILNKHAT
ncbi:MAG: polysaccharide pyruvyl transferase family protein [Candidatus Aenigmatarchaeota archaeon]